MADAVPEPVEDFIETDLGPLGKVHHRRDRQVVPLTEPERSVLTGLVSARNAVMSQIEGYLTNVISARLGVHRNRILNADVNTGIITLASDAPKPEPAKG